MGSLPAPIRLDNAATGNSADGQIHRNLVDDAFGAMASKILYLLRSDTLQYNAAAIIDSLGNPLSNAAHASLTKTASDANFANNPSISVPTAVGNMFLGAAGQIGVAPAPVAMTNSFTFVTGLHLPSSGLNSPTLFGDNAGTNGSSNQTGFALTNSGVLEYILGSTSFINTAYTPIALGSTGVLWASFDASTSILRAGVNNGAVAYQATTAFNRTGAGTGTVVNPFGFGTSGGGSGYSFHRWALFNKAFMNGAVPGDDAQFSALVSLYASFI